MIGPPARHGSTAWIELRSSLDRRSTRRSDGDDRISERSEPSPGGHPEGDAWLTVRSLG